MKHPGFDGVFRSIDQVPQAALESSTKEFLDACRAGPQGFLSRLRPTQPRTCDAIERSCGDFCFLTIKFAHAPVLYAGFDWGPDLLLFNPYNIESIEHDRKDELPQCLPAGLRCYYGVYNGLQRCAKDGAPSLSPQQVPMKLGSLVTLEDYRKMKRLKPEKIAPLVKLAKGADLRIWCYEEKKHYLFVDRSLTQPDEPKEPPLYYVKDHDFAQARALKLPASTMDRYFAHVISRASGEFDFLQVPDAPREAPEPGH